MGPRVILAAAAVCSVAARGAPPPTDDEIELMWGRFKSESPKVYSSEPSRSKAFKHNALRAHAMNEEQGAACSDLFDGPECVFGVTRFSDMFEDEFALSRLGYKPAGERAPPAPVLSVENLLQAPDALDWRTKGAVSEVKDQGVCGSCWAFSAVEAIESATFMATGKLPVLSTQQVISCDKVDDGCDGGNTETAYAYVKKAGGLDAAADYPDKSHSTGKGGKCSWDHKEVVKDVGFAYAVKPCKTGMCTHQDEAGLARAVATKGPVSICVNAAGWQVYMRGIYSRKCNGASAELDHCVQAVGYDRSGETPYWIVRNSWGREWGMNGYMHLKMGDNACGVADDATIPDVAPGLLTV